ncbi:hypothetical protein Pan216_42560 [Planctomycetes bacterium Pan216]|uniref:Uncharacterized protein n=1 Tax=Kolteria novifilia TaxID=2527975 RepID=A0A518B8S8_9BACT|nr:hypothetical protein Pan216_42560 [Planctomycetes bacterium Pan216]
MDSRQVHAKVNDIARVVRNGGKQEDSFSELKLSLPDSGKHRIARQIAGAANAAMDQEILFIVGIDESAEKKVEQHQEDEISSILPSIMKYLGEPKPRLKFAQNVILEDGGESVVALVFHTDESPYRVQFEKDPNKYEVPWRDGTITRSAYHSDLLRILNKRVKTPELIARDATFSKMTYTVSGTSIETLCYKGIIEVLIEYQGASSVLVDTGRLSCKVDGQTSIVQIFNVKDSTAPRVVASKGGIIIHSSGFAEIELVFSEPVNLAGKSEKGLVLDLGFHISEIRDVVPLRVPLAFKGMSSDPYYILDLRGRNDLDSFIFGDG